MEITWTEQKLRQLLREVLLRAAPVESSQSAARQAGTTFRWVVVMELTGHGSGVSRAICEEFGLNPDERVRWR